MRRINYLILALSASLAFAACSDDDDKDKDNGQEEVDCKLEENKDHEDCQDGNNGEEGGLCTGQEDAYAAIEDDITDIATDVATQDCGALGYVAEEPTEEELAELEDCVANGIADTEDVEIDADCASCTAAVVSCAVVNCVADCGPAGNDADCEECREENGCDEGYAECQFGEDAGNGGDDEDVLCEDEDVEGCIDCEDAADADHELCEVEGGGDVLCGENETPEEDDCIDCEEDDEHELCEEQGDEDVACDEGENPEDTGCIDCADENNVELDACQE